jgi:GAF domain-containing protein
MHGPDDVDEGLVALAQLAESAPLEETLRTIAQWAVDLMPNATGAALTAFDDDSPSISVATSSHVKTADEAQFKLGEGPCITAIGQREVVMSALLAAEPMWPRYAGRVSRLGLRSVLAIPLVLADELVAVLAVYAQSKDAFTWSDTLVAKRYAVPAAAIVQNARVLAQYRTEIEQLREALRIRPLIDQAVGIVRSRTGESEEEVFKRLRAISNVQHVKVSELAAHIVDDAVRHRHAS